MHTSLEQFAGLISISACAWLLFGIFVSLRIQFFIVRRYEHETDLLKTIWFREHATFTRMMPNFLSSSLYVAHLLSVVWFWNYCRTKKAFRDISAPGEITGYFSNQEIRRVKSFAFVGIILLAHGLVYSVISLLWPGAFN